MFSNVPCGIENQYFSRYCHKVRNVIIVTKQIRIMLAMKVLKAIFDFCFFCFFWTNRFTLLFPSLYLLMCDLSLHALFFLSKILLYTANNSKCDVHHPDFYQNNMTNMKVNP